jgi:predicted extracellular nuclease
MAVGGAAEPDRGGSSVPLAHRILGCLTLAVAVVLIGSPAASPSSSDLFFSEYVEGTGNNNKALEIYNGTGVPINLATGLYGVQMYFNGSTSPGLTINLSGTVAPGDVFVLAHTFADPAILAQADQLSSPDWYDGNDAVVLVKGIQKVDVIGQIGSNPGTEWGTGATSTADNTLRRKGTIEAGDPNGADAFDPAVQWDGFPVDTFGGLGSHTIVTDDAPTVSSTSPANGAAGVAVDSNVMITFSEDVSVSGSWFTISCSTSGAHSATSSGGPATFTLDPTTNFAPAETCTVTVTGSLVSDVDSADPPDTMAADYSFSFSTVSLRIHDIQGATHISPHNLENVADVPGIVTALALRGFYMQDSAADADDATSEGIFVFTSVAPTVLVGDSVTVSGRAVELRAGGSASTNLTLTQIDRVTSLQVVSSGNPLPAPTVLGNGGRVPPAEVIEDDATGSVETSGVFDPSADGIDFYESVEEMRVQLNDAVAVGPTSAFGEIPVVGDGGANAGIRTVRGGVVIRPTDFNPERVILDDTLVPTPLVNVGDGFTSSIAGVIDYSFGNFKLNVTTSPVRVNRGLMREVTRLPIDQEIVFATYNVENLDPGDGAAFARHADLIVNHLRAPDVIAIEEIQDNNGAVNDSVTDASVTWNMLIDAITAAGGPQYEYRQIDPVDDQDGGEPGGNIRVGFLLRTDRGVHFIDRPGGDSTTPTTVIADPSGPQLSFSPGRVDPQNPAFVSTRKSLAVEIRAHGKKLFAIVNHFSSKTGDHPLFGRFQPPVRSSEVARHAQAQAVNDFVDEILAADPQANVIVLGDINDFEFSETVDLLEGGVLTTLMDTLPKAERYSYDFEGNSQVLDQMLASGNLLGNFPIDYDPVHVNSEFADQASDHDPQVARLDLRGRPVP